MPTLGNDLRNGGSNEPNKNQFRFLLFPLVPFLDFQISTPQPAEETCRKIASIINTEENGTALNSLFTYACEGEMKGSEFTFKIFWYKRFYLGWSQANKFYFPNISGRVERYGNGSIVNWSITAPLLPLVISLGLPAYLFSTVPSPARIKVVGILLFLHACYHFAFLFRAYRSEAFFKRLLDVRGSEQKTDRILGNY